VTYWDSDETKWVNQNVLRISFHKQIIIATILLSGAYRSELRIYPIELILIDAFVAQPNQWFGNWKCICMMIHTITYLINFIVSLSLLIRFTLFLSAILPQLYIDFSWFILRPMRFVVHWLLIRISGNYVYHRRVYLTILHKKISYSFNLKQRQ
jgi:hypothetical protein